LLAMFVVFRAPPSGAIIRTMSIHLDDVLATLRELARTPLSAVSSAGS